MAIKKSKNNESITDFDNMMNEVEEELEVRQAEQDIVNQVPEGNEIATVENIAHTAMLLFAGYIDAATSMSESCGGGGGSTPELGWGKKDDEDERAYARRCLLMAHSMYKPKTVKRGFHR